MLGRQFIKERLPDAPSIYLAELRAIYVAARHIVDSQKNKFIICLESMSCKQAIENLDIDHPIFLGIVLFISYAWNTKNLVLCWVSSHVRHRYYAVENIQELLDNVCPQLIINFLKGARHSFLI